MTSVYVSDKLRVDISGDRIAFVSKSDYGYWVEPGVSFDLDTSASLVASAIEAEARRAEGVNKSTR